MPPCDKPEKSGDFLRSWFLQWFPRTLVLMTIGSGLGSERETEPPCRACAALPCFRQNGDECQPGEPGLNLTVDPQFFCRERMLRGRPLPHKVPSCLVRSVWQVTDGRAGRLRIFSGLGKYVPDRHTGRRARRGCSEAAGSSSAPTISSARSCSPWPDQSAPDKTSTCQWLSRSDGSRPESWGYKLLSF